MNSWNFIQTVTGGLGFILLSIALVGILVLFITNGLKKRFNSSIVRFPIMIIITIAIYDLLLGVFFFPNDEYVNFGVGKGVFIGIFIIGLSVTLSFAIITILWKIVFSKKFS
ncbi:hypothetical protein [Salirhabdus salicampi]|uniref:hypothetical protein n=1 Tax=Salirhabdus salicampi TaxID=476102 RepID=UPI0020C358D7|nr:hypothetical protein [Salirhabdus salicampi]MCP8615822.1 hypothetical protein [Salirhabdus salicampi]